MKKKSISIILAILASAISAFAQTVPPAGNIPKPRIIVLPKVKPTDDYRQVYDSVDLIRSAIAKINEELLKKGASVVDFDAVYRQIKENDRVRQGAGIETDENMGILIGTLADIYIELEIIIIDHEQGKYKSAVLNMKAYQTGTSTLMSSSSGNSPMFQTDDYTALAKRALTDMLPGFLDIIMMKFRDVYENGQSVYVEFSIRQDSNLTFDDEVTPSGQGLAEVIYEWFQKKTVNGVFNYLGVVSNMLVISDARIPLKKPDNPNSNYTVVTFFSDINNYLKTLNIKCIREIGTTGKIIITIKKISK